MGEPLNKNDSHLHYWSGVLEMQAFYARCPRQGAGATLAPGKLHDAGTDEGE
jgi:hypothetical protein